MGHDYNAPRRFKDNPIARARLKKGMTQGQLAEAIGATQAQLSSWENGLRRVSAIMLIRIAEVLEVDIDSLIDEKQKVKEASPIAIARRKRGMSQVELAQAIGIPQARISRLETHVQPPEDILQRISDVLEVDIDSLRYTKKVVSPITAARKRKGWTQTQLADAVGMSLSMISNYETGRHTPSESVLARLAEALEVKLEELQVK